MLWAGPELVGTKDGVHLSAPAEGWVNKHKCLYLTFKAFHILPIPTYPISFPILSKFRFSTHQFGLLAVLSKHRTIPDSWPWLRNFLLLEWPIVICFPSQFFPVLRAQRQTYHSWTFSDIKTCTSQVFWHFRKAPHRQVGHILSFIICYFKKRINLAFPDEILSFSKKECFLYLTGCVCRSVSFAKLSILGRLCPTVGCLSSFMSPCLSPLIILNLLISSLLGFLPMLVHWFLSPFVGLGLLSSSVSIWFTQFSSESSLLFFSWYLP